MTDREMLHLAAKAAGYKVIKEFTYQITVTCGYPNLFDGVDFFGLVIDDGDKIKSPWNPLDDDGDALRLAVRLGISITPYPIYSKDKHAVIVKQRRYGDAMRESNPTEVLEPYGEDREAAVRRAIVRSAAAIVEAQHENS